jgi:hypothetical protein
LSNWRAARVFHPKVIGELRKEGPFGVNLPDSDEGRVLAEEQVATLAAMEFGVDEGGLAPLAEG